MLCKLHYTLPSQREFGPPVVFNIYLPAVEARDWVVRDKTYDMQPTVKITSKLEDVA